MSPDAQARRILIADDDDHSRNIMTEAMRSCGYEVAAVDGGNSAFSEVEKGGVDLVITDLRMKDGTGIELLRGLRRLQLDGRNIPKVIVTTGLIEGGERYLKAFGVSDIFVKPVDLDLLQKAVQKALS